jgi:PEP-CTERM motif
MAVRRLILLATLVACLALTGPAWAGTLTFNGFDANGQGLLSFTPGLGNSLTIGAGNGGSGAMVTNLLTGGINPLLCGGNCNIVGGYLTLASGPETGGFTGGGIFSYSFGAGGNVKIMGEIPTLGINSPTVLFMASLLPGTTFSGAGTVGSFLGQINLASIVLAAGLGTYHYTGGSNDDLSFGISPSCSTGGICTGSLVQSTTSLQTIPEPATLSVLGVGLFAFGAGLRRRMGRTKPAVTA